MVEPQPGEQRLRVAEAFVEDVDRGWARLDPDDLLRLGAAPGDVLLVTGGRSTVARAVQAPESHRGQGLILMDGSTRGNAQAGVDDTVRVRKVPFRPAASLLLAAVEASLPTPAEAELPALRHALSGRPFLLGDRFQLTALGARTRSFTVEGAAPRGALLVSNDTEIAFRAPDAAAAEGARISYEDIGGLDRQVALVREMVELPLRFPELFGALGIEPPRGVLLVGPPGTGKTLIARAASSEVRAHFIHVNGPEVINKYYGESEAKLRAVFEEARRNAPAIIFLDEIDALAPKRAQVIGDVEKRVVAQLLALMDGLVERGQVVVIGATNLPEVVDPALRRPGRFDREITLGVPDRAGRRKILSIHSRRMPLAAEVDLERLAEITHGYVGADLAALCTEAGMVALRRILPAVTFELDERPRLDGLTIEVTQPDFLEAFKAIEPTSTREFLAERPPLGFADVGGLAREKRTLRSIVEVARGGGALVPGARLDPPKGVLLTGPSGTGKTLLARALAGELGLTLITVDLTTLLSKWVGESEKGLREVFRRAKQASPCILFFDDVEAIAPARSGEEGGGLAPRLVAQLVRELGQLHGSLGVVVLGATNRPDLLDPALLRPGRFDYLLELPLPAADERREILALHARGLTLGAEDLGEVARRTEGCTGADLELVCKKAAILALEDGRQRQAPLEITRSHVEQALEQVRGAAVLAIRSPGAPRRSAV
ncbi:MAG TPA: AAA family ATPase [Anaeromyxobacter sp.]|nr:AAA family ATPase [Anaeromyxobacter sp.]